MLNEDEWEWLEEHLERRLRPPADRHLGPAGAGAGPAPRRALGRGGRARRLGRRRPRSGREAAPHRPTSTTGRRSATRSTASPSCSPGPAPGSSATRRPRSPCSPATSTTPTWPSSPSRAPTASAATSGRRSARRFETRSTTASARRSTSATRASRRARSAALARLAGVRARAGPLAPGRGPVLRQPGRDADARRPRGRAAARAHGRRPRDRPPRAPHLVRAPARLSARPGPAASVRGRGPRRARFDRPPGPAPSSRRRRGRRGSRRSKPSRWRIEAASPERLPPLQIAAIGRSAGSSPTALDELAVGDVERARDVAGRELGGVADVEHDQASSPASSRSASSSGSISSSRLTCRPSDRQAVIPPARKPRTRRPTEASRSAAASS